MEFLSSTHNETSFLNSTKNLQSSGRRQATGIPIQRSMSTQSLNRNYPPVVPSSSPRDLPMQDQSTPASAQLLTRLPVSPITKELRQRTTRRDHHIPRHGSNRGTLRTPDKSESSSSDKINGNVDTLLASYDEPKNKNPVTAAGNSSDDKRLTRTDVKSGVPQENSSMSIRHNSVPRLDLTDVQYSHRGPPSIRTSDSTDFKATIWYVHVYYLKSHVSLFYQFQRKQVIIIITFNIYNLYYKSLNLLGIDPWDVQIATMYFETPLL